MDHTIELLNNVSFFYLGVFKIFIENVSSLNVVSVMNHYFFSIRWAEHSAVSGVDQTVELVNLSSVSVSIEVLIVPVVRLSLDVFPFNVNFSTSGRVKLFSVGGMDHTIELTHLKDLSGLLSFLFSLVSLKHIIIDFFVIDKINILTMPL